MSELSQLFAVLLEINKLVDKTAGYGWPRMLKSWGNITFDYTHNAELQLSIYFIEEVAQDCQHADFFYFSPAFCFCFSFVPPPIVVYRRINENVGVR